LEQYKLPIKACQTFKLGTQSSASATDYYEDEFTSIKNLMCQLNSLATVTSMWRERKREYDVVMYLRPDMLYNCRLPVEHIAKVQDNRIYIADFHHWHGYNDRFAMGLPHVVGNWGERCADLP
jgi:hypothetical protein